MFTPTAKILADSISVDNGHRLTTMEVTGHRFILAEFNTHRALSRNSASSRAIPYAKMREKALSQTAYPVSWPSEQKGMQGGVALEFGIASAAQMEWEVARDAAVKSADRLHTLGVHKSVINRLLEPFLPHTIIVSATEWDGFWAQRCHPDAQPEIKALAEAMMFEYDNSEPRELGKEDWHLPLVDEVEWDDMLQNHGWEYTIDAFRKISVARCARVSYLTHDGVRDLDKDMELYNRLYTHRPAHASPFEHVATPNTTDHDFNGNFRGWAQLRHLLSLG